MPEVASPQIWAREVAEKIHAHEAANVDETVENRSVELAALLRKLLGAIPPSVKGAYLDELDTHFPAMSSSATVAPASADEATESESAASTIRRLLPDLSGVERSELLRQLLNDAFRDSQSGTRLGRLLSEVSRRGNSPVTAPLVIDPDRALRVLEVFCEAVLGLQRLAIELWRDAGARKLSGAPTLASDSDFRALVARCLSGDSDTPPAMIDQEVERQRRSIAAAMAMLGPFADHYAQAVLKPLAPQSIAAQTSSDSFSVFGSRESGYWKQFCRTWDSLGQEHFETTFVECLAKHLRNLNRPNP